MTVDRIVHLVAGLMVLAGIALSYAVHPYWLGLSVFVGHCRQHTIGATRKALLSTCTTIMKGDNH